MAEKISEAFLKLAKLAAHDGIALLNTLDGCWTRQIGEQWWIAINGHNEAHPASSPDGASKNTPFEVKPFHCYVEFNGWPAGVFTPCGGVIASGETGNEDAFIAAIDAAITEAMVRNALTVPGVGLRAHHCVVEDAVHEPARRAYVPPKGPSGRPYSRSNRR